MASCRWVRPLFTMPSFSASRRLKVSIRVWAAGISFSSRASTAAMCIAVGKVSLEDWLILTSSLGCRMLLPAIWLPRLAMTSLVFMLDWVPEPVCHTTRGKWPFSSPAITSSQAALMASIFSSVIFSGRRAWLAIESAFFRMPKAWMISAGIVSMPTPISKFSRLLWVWAAHRRSAGTFISPIESCSMRYSITCT